MVLKVANVVLDSDHESRVNTKFVGEGSSRRDIDTVPGFYPTEVMP